MTQRIHSVWADERASQLVEFAVSLPLLVVFVVGIFDFSGAFSAKHELANAAREGARAAAAGPANDLVGNNTLSVPVSVSDAAQVVDNYLVRAQINDCGLASTTGSAAGTLTWTYTASGCPGGGSLVLTINRGYYFPQNSTQPTADCTPQTPNGQLAIIATCISIQYPYPWQFKRVISLIGATSNVPSNLTTVAVALNEN